MKPCIAALTGLSGVGKSTFLRSLAATLDFQHLQASTLIKEARQGLESRNIEFDQLRYFDLDDNQQLLVHGFQAKVDPIAKLVILDGHTLIERGDEIVLIAPPVFAAVGISMMFFLTDSPQTIAVRRANDASRQRPLKTVEELRNIQELAERRAAMICETLNIRLHVIGHSHLTGVDAILRSLLD